MSLSQKKRSLNPQEAVAGPLEQESEWMDHARERSSKSSRQRQLDREEGAEQSVHVSNHCCGS